jgi:hypothetical protein
VEHNISGEIAAAIVRQIRHTRTSRGTDFERGGTQRVALIIPDHGEVPAVNPLEPRAVNGGARALSREGQVR